MKIAFFDSTAVVTEGPGSPAYFSRFLIRQLRKSGHSVVISTTFNEDLCREADIVVCEWVNQDAYSAAASGACKRLVLRMRGFDAHGPLDQLNWANVDLLVFESFMLREFVTSRFPKIGTWCPHNEVIASGIDVEGAPFIKREPPAAPVVALVARATNDKGYQLAFEWARQRRVKLHVTLALPETSPRLVEYLKASKPRSVEIHGTVNTMPWLNEIGATHVLSASIWETLGYTMAEGMAVGCKPLIHMTPGAVFNWPSDYLWRSLSDLDVRLDGPYSSDEYRAFALDNFDERKLSEHLIDLMLRIVPRQVDSLLDNKYEQREQVIGLIDAACKNSEIDIDDVKSIVENFRSNRPVNGAHVEDRYSTACGMSVAYLIREDVEHAAQWACRALMDSPWPDAMCLMGEIAARRDAIEDAIVWYEAACNVPDPPRRTRIPALVDVRDKRLAELRSKRETVSESLPFTKFAVVVTVRNAEKWIRDCLLSISVQGLPLKCVVVDDASTDATAAIARDFVSKDTRFVLVENTERKYQARNLVEGVKLATDDPQDIVVCVDGDDCLTPKALERIQQEYVRGAWMTYGNFVTSEGKRSHLGAYPDRIAKAGEFSNWPWQATQPRTFKRFLIDHLTDEDFLLDGQWPAVAGDVCVALPLLQLCCERARPISDSIYVYNLETPLNDHKQDPDEQVRVRDLLLRRPKKQRLAR